jgi:hypothetical protein
MMTEVFMMAVPGIRAARRNQGAPNGKNRREGGSTGGHLYERVGGQTAGQGVYIACLPARAL